MPVPTTHFVPNPVDAVRPGSPFLWWCISLFYINVSVKSRLTLSNFLPRIRDLSGIDWQFGSVTRRPFDAPNVDDRAGVAEWLPACVPGNVRNDLLAQDRIPDPFFSDGYHASLWVEDCDWWYRCPLDISIEPDQRAFLVFYGIDYLSAIFLSGQELGRHEGMFGRQVYEITDVLHQTPDVSAPIEIAVRLWGSGALPRRHLSRLERGWSWLVEHLYPTGMGAFPDRMATLKCQMSFGWDFAPPIRTMGIWDDVWLVVTGGVFIEDVWITSELQDSSAELARLTIRVSVDSDRSRSVAANVRMRPANFDGSDFGPVSFNLDLPPGRSTHTLTFDVPTPRLWEPWDRGFPHLYELTLSLQPSTPSSQPLDTVSTRFGIRYISLEDWIVSLNGRCEFVRGVNWVPADSLPGRLRRDDYAELLGMARAAGVNLLRVWSGGLREKSAFYDLCDELGLLVWQEFPFACSFLGYFPRDPGWLGLVERECTAIVREVRNHPSVALWCGGNEFSPRRNQPLVHTLTRVVEAHDGTRPFVPASPSSDDTHNWDVWHGKYPLHTYRKEGARFLSEFGLQAAPSIETLRACLPETDLWPPDAAWEVHKAELGKLWRYVGLTLPPTPSIEGKGSLSLTPLSLQGREAGVEGESGDLLQDFIAASQRVQALGLQIAIEHIRRRKGEMGGVCLWQFNEPWPAISWAIVDYFRRPKLAYQRLKGLYNPVLVGLTFPTTRYRPGDTLEGEVWAVNDSLEALDDCQLRIEIDGMEISKADVTLPPDSTEVVGVLRHQFQTEPHDLQLTMNHGGRVIAYNYYDLTYDDPAMPGWRERLVRWLARMALR
jgi:beta-mannosidase